MTDYKSIKSNNTFWPKKRLGQHFLQNREIINEIINLSQFDNEDTILEIGPGLGALTIPLSRLANKILAIEKDSQLVDKLENKLSKDSIENVTLVHKDILRYNFNEVKSFSKEKIHVIGNVPYNISSPILESLMENRHLIKSAILMLQYELAQRLTSAPGAKTYGALTVLIQYNAKVSRLLEVPKEAFYPKPKVGSMVIKLDFDHPYSKRAKDDKVFKKIVKAAFSHRRKTIINSMKASLSPPLKDNIQSALKECCLDSIKRAETLHIDDFLCLCSAIIPHS